MKKLFFLFIILSSCICIETEYPEGDPCPEYIIEKCYGVYTLWGEVSEGRKDLLYLANDPACKLDETNEKK